MAVVLTAALMLPPAPYMLSDIEPPCQPGLIHYSVLCLTAAEFEAMWNPPTTNSAPITHELVVGVERWRLMVEYFWDEPDTSRMLRILRCESNGDPRAYNGKTGVRGLFQVHPLWQKPWPGDYYDPWTNAAVAYQIWLQQGFGAWVCKG